MAIYVKDVLIGEDCSFGSIPLGQISFGPTVVWEKYVVVPNSMVLEVDKSVTDLELPLYQYKTAQWDVNWGDGSKESMGTKHSYTDGGVRNHLVTISGAAGWKNINQSGFGTGLKDGLLNVTVVGTCPIRLWYTYSFTKCAKLASIDEKLFNGAEVSDNTTAEFDSVRECFGYGTDNAWSMLSFFSGCTALTSIPAKLFKNIPAAVRNRDYNNLYMSFMFAKTGITSIPEDLFDGGLPSKLVWSTRTDGQCSLPWMFQDCHSLKYVPDKLFSYLPSPVQALFLNGVYSYCTSLTDTGNKLFSKLPTIQGNYENNTKPNAPLSPCLQGAFTMCEALELNTGVLTGVPNSSAWDIRYMFSYCSKLGNYRNTAYPVDEAWKTHGSCKHDGFYLGAAAGASNYSSIPSGWK